MLILSAGMQRSASTWLYNVIRLLVNASNEYDDNFNSGWIDDVHQFADTGPLLNKLHAYDQALAAKADLIFYSFRDLRDVLASSKRKFNTNPTIEQADGIIQQYYLWKDVSSYTMCYENMIVNPLLEITNIAQILNIFDVNLHQIQSNLQSLSYNTEGAKTDNYNKHNLYHNGHLTDGRQSSWHNELNEDLSRQVFQKYKNWFTVNNYT